MKGWLRYLDSYYGLNVWCTNVSDMMSCVCIHTCTYIYIHIHIQVYTICVFEVFSCFLCMHAYIYIYIYIYVYICKFRSCNFSLIWSHGITEAFRRSLSSASTVPAEDCGDLPNTKCFLLVCLV